jgi:hypothetical protein
MVMASVMVVMPGPGRGFGGTAADDQRNGNSERGARAGDLAGREVLEFEHLDQSLETVLLRSAASDPRQVLRRAPFDAAMRREWGSRICSARIELTWDWIG